MGWEETRPLLGDLIRFLVPDTSLRPLERQQEILCFMLEDAAYLLARVLSPITPTVLAEPRTVGSPHRRHPCYS
jgi:hypothetical protein